MKKNYVKPELIIVSFNVDDGYQTSIGDDRNKQGKEHVRQPWFNYANQDGAQENVDDGIYFE